MNPTPIHNNQLYLSRMDLSIKDKLFFTDKIEFDVIVDFGCANGALLSTLREMYPNVKIIGYDTNPDMLSSAREILGNDVVLTNDWNLVITELRGYDSPLLNLSSVIHEVYSYSDSDEIHSFWNNYVYSGLFKYISIRDMIPSKVINNFKQSLFRNDIAIVRELYDDIQYIDSFESTWGTLCNNYRTFMHFLLKYRYVENWDREVSENYLPIFYEEMEEFIPNNYNIIYKSHFVLPFLQERLISDFGIKFRHTTHSKYIIELN